MGCLASTTRCFDSRDLIFDLRKLQNHRFAKTNCKIQHLSGNESQVLKTKLQNYIKFQIPDNESHVLKVSVTKFKRKIPHLSVTKIQTESPKSQTTKFQLFFKKQSVRKSRNEIADKQIPSSKRRVLLLEDAKRFSPLVIHEAVRTSREQFFVKFPLPDRT